jgi:putative sigma-54 modulation protein
MTLTVTGRHLTVSETTRADIARRLQRLRRVLNDSAVSSQCILARESQVFVCEMTLHARGDHMLHAVGRHARLPAAVASAVEKVSQQAHKLSDRWKTRRRGGPARTPAPPAPLPPPVPALAAGAATRERTQPRRQANGPRVIRTRPESIKPMNLDDAVLALQEGDRPFLVFRQAPSETMAILYRRPDGHFGLIEPEA